MQQLLRPTEAAKQLGVARQTISRAMRRGRLKYIMVAGLRLIRPADLQAYAAVKDVKPGRPRKAPAIE